MKQRIISALIAIPIFAWILLGAPLWVFAAGWTLIIGVAAYEWSKLMVDASHEMKYGFTALCTSLSAGALFLLSTQSVPLVMGVLAIFIPPIALLLWLVLVPILLKHYAHTGKIYGGTKMLFALGNFFFPAFAIAVICLKNMIGGYGLLGLLILVWASDAGAYFIGKAIGKTKFSPNISPNKTWEGFTGGVGVALCLATILYFNYPILLQQHFSVGNFIYWLFISVIALIYASLGDLFESMLKRKAGVKDSGTIMPGHGGAYDRIDSWLSGLLIWFLGIYLITLTYPITYSDQFRAFEIYFKYIKP